jgi:hypothetical protein
VCVCVCVCVCGCVCVCVYVCVCADAHDGDAAVEHFEKAIELEPSDSAYHYELGVDEVPQRRIVNGLTCVVTGGMFKRSEFATLLDVPRALHHVQRALELGA